MSYEIKAWQQVQIYNTMSEKFGHKWRRECHSRLSLPVLLYADVPCSINVEFKNVKIKL